VDPSLDTPQLPLVFNVLALYWGEDLVSRISEKARVQYKAVRGSVLIEGIEVAEKNGFQSMMYKSNMKDIKKTIDQGGDGLCSGDEDCGNCPSDCASKTGGKPSARYCCGDGTAQAAEGDGAVCDGNY
jgi:hypothetical protein